MKACLLLRIWVLGLVLAPCFTNAQHQIAQAVYTYNDPENSISCNVPLNEINIHAYRRFHRLFPTGTTGEYWFKSAEGYQVSFVQDALRHQAYFDLRGSYLYSLKYYGGTKMPGGPAEVVRKKYPGFGIEVVTEITDGEKTFYLVKIVNPSSVKTLSVCEGKVELLEELVNGGSE
ncbi:MAG TPA: hypothetical protein VL727_10830 [Puia sp.]|nr:hypothetical protein [Puia sp.]